MTSILNPTFTIFKNRKIKFDFDTENDNRKIVASEDIYKGDLLIVEHGINDIIDEKNTSKELINRTALNLLYNQDYYNELYPRNYKHNLDSIINNIVDDENNYTTSITDKISKNSFKHPIDNDKSLYVLFRDIVKFNHSISPNSNHHYIQINVPNIDIPIIIYFIVCSKDILKGEEITINYGNGYFNENIDLTDYNNKNQDYFKKNDNKIKKLIFKYINSNNFNDVIYNHHLYSNGLVYTKYQDKYKYVGMPSFYKKCNENLNRDENVDITINEMNEWINTQLFQLNYNIKIYLRTIKNKF